MTEREELLEALTWLAHVVMALIAVIVCWWLR